MEYYMIEHVKNKIPQEEIQINTKEVSCNGDINSAHPKVYLKVAENNKVICPYCSKVFLYNQSVGN